MIPKNLEDFKQMLLTRSDVRIDGGCYPQDLTFNQLGQLVMALAEHVCEQNGEIQELKQRLQTVGLL